MKAWSGAALELVDLTVSYQGHPAVHHLSGRFEPGTLTALVGPNGAGKSSLLGALAGTLSGWQGRIEQPAGWRSAYLPQAGTLDRSVPMRLDELVAMGLWHQIGSLGRVSAAQREQVQQALQVVGLGGLERRWLGELSTGQLQRALFARVLLQDARLILLDEPFNAIDARTTADLLALLPRWRDQTRTVIAALHDLDQVRAHFDQTLLLAREPIAWGPTAEVLKAEHLFRARQLAQRWDEEAAWCRDGVRASVQKPAHADG
ncbi:MAG: metal ABC transporter ATP-binding protein [Rubrivivax sp.]|nr:metal ABC transporter ATP-binding protein [Rubrivivax sp.]